MALGKRALDVLNRMPEINEELEYCGKGTGLTDEIHRFVRSLEGPIRGQLDLDQWSQKVETDGGAFIWLNLFPSSWRLCSDEFVAFAISWCNPFDEEAEDPCVCLRVPPLDAFPERDKLLKRVRPVLIKAGFEDHLPAQDAEPYWPLWKYVSLDAFRSESGFDSAGLAKYIVETFRGLMPAAELVTEVLKSLPRKATPPAAQRPLTVVAFVDTETSGTGAAAKMTEFAVINAAYDKIGDQIVGVLEEYSIKAPKKLDQSKARCVLGRAEVIVAHNAEFDRALVERALPGAEKSRWLCSWHGIDWKNLNEVQSESLQSLLGAEGLRSGQDHTALADARDLLRLMAVHRDGKTYLARLLGNSLSAKAGSAT